MPNNNRTTSNREWLIWGALALLPGLFLAIALLMPLVAILRLGLSWAALASVIGDPYYRGVIWFSCWQALLSTLLTLLVGIPLAYVFAHYRFPGRSLLRAAALLPFVLPTVVVVAGIQAFVSPQGPLAAAARMLNLTRLSELLEAQILLQGSLALMLAGHVLYNAGLVLRVVGSAWESIDPRLNQAAAVLGIPAWQRFWRITLPQLLPALGAAALLTFLFCFGSFGVVLLLGGIRIATIEVAIYRLTTQTLDLDAAATLSLIQVVLTLLIGGVSGRVSITAGRTDLRLRLERLRPPRHWHQRLLVGCAAALIITMLLPFGALAWRSITPGRAPEGQQVQISFDAYRALNQNRRGSIMFVPPARALLNSFAIALLTTLLALGIGIPAALLLAAKLPAWLAWLADGLFTLPLGVSAVMLGLGMIVAWGPLGMLASPWLIPLAHTLLAFPFVVRALAPALRARNPRLREVARCLGVSPFTRLWRIEIPLLAPALGVAMVLAFTSSLGEFGAALLLTRPEYPTVPMVIARLLGQPGASNYGQAMALSTLLMLASVAAFLLLERLQPRQLSR